VNAAAQQLAPGSFARGSVVSRFVCGQDRWYWLIDVAMGDDAGTIGADKTPQSASR